MASRGNQLPSWVVKSLCSFTVLWTLTSVLVTLLVGDLLNPVVLDLVLSGVVGLMLPLL